MIRENLERLADHLEQLDGPFEMWTLGQMTPSQREIGSCGCALARGPDIGIPGLPGEGWREYALRVFGVKISDWDRESREYSWLFHPGWCNVDNTASGASIRIREYLQSGVPSWYSGRPSKSQEYLDLTRAK